MFDEVFHALSRCLAGLAQPFRVPGTEQLFKPKIFITILAYSSIIGLASHQVSAVASFENQHLMQHLLSHIVLCCKFADSDFLFIYLM